MIVDSIPTQTSRLPSDRPPRQRHCGPVYLPALHHVSASRYPSLHYCSGIGPTNRFKGNDVLETPQELRYVCCGTVYGYILAICTGKVVEGMPREIVYGEGVDTQESTGGTLVRIHDGGAIVRGAQMEKTAVETMPERSARS